MAKESTQKKIARDRAPRVQIMYDVEVGDATEQKELPFVLGVLGDYGGKPKAAPEKLKDRKFVQVEKDNFDDVLGGIAPRLELQVENRLSGTGGRLAVELNFAKLEDFEPISIVGQVDPLRQLEKLEELLDGIVRDTENLQRLVQAPQDKGE
jgi:type VI secretion system protein ImpB